MRELAPHAAADLLASESDRLFVDVRTVEEFVAGHPEGAVNVPVAEQNPSGQMVPAPEFAQIIQALAPDTKTTLVFSCKAGPRSRYACELMEAAGYASTVNVTGGFSDWKPLGLPVSADNGDGVSYESIRARTVGGGD